jgi:hypothetical protein
MVTRMDERLITIIVGAALILLGAATAEGHLIRRIWLGLAKFDLSNGHPDETQRIGPPKKRLVAAGVAIMTVGALTDVIVLTSSVRSLLPTDSSASPTTGPPNSSISPTIPTSTSPPLETLPTGVVKITSPSDGQQVIGHEGVWLRGIAGELGSNHLRIFDHADNGLYYLIDNGPLSVSNKQWSFFDPQIGSGTPGDVGHTFVLVAAVSNATCDQSLAASQPDVQGDVSFTKLPDGCAEASNVRVIKKAQ